VSDQKSNHLRLLGHSEVRKTKKRKKKPGKEKIRTIPQAGKKKRHGGSRSGGGGGKGLWLLVEVAGANGLALIGARGEREAEKAQENPWMQGGERHQ